MSVPPSRGRGRDPTRARGQARVLARTRKEWMIDLYAGLDDPERFEPPAQPGATLPDADADPDDADSDDDGSPEADDGVGIAQVIGSRPGVVLLGLELIPDGVQARLLVHPRPEEPGEAEVLGELQAFVEARFAHGKTTLSADAWDRLVGTKPASPLRRAALVARLAATGNTAFAPGRPDTPNDRGLEQFRGKFAALPDGMPFGLRLLIRDGRGDKRRKDDDPNSTIHFSGLPWFVRLQALARALQQEEREVLRDETVDPTLLTDAAFAKRLYDAVNSLLGGDVPVREPAITDLTELRRTLKTLANRPATAGLAGFFPNATDRAARYRLLQAEPEGGRPMGTV